MLDVIQALQFSSDMQNGVLFLFLYMLIDYVSVNVEDDVEAVIMDHGENGLSPESCMSMGQNSEVNSGVHHVAQVVYGNYHSFLLWSNS